MNQNEELMHYGVRGMKWGVRRYQNYDGSYTKKGVARFKEAEGKYDSAKKAYDSAKVGGNKSDIRRTKSDVRSAKRKMSSAYKQLKYDKRGDEGKKLYQQGKTIIDNNIKNRYGQLGIFIGANALNQIAGQALNKRQAVLITKKHGTIPMSQISQAAIGVGSTVATAMLQGKTRSDNKKLRAYYSHTGNRVYG